jgi:hypothetical protein
VNGRLDSLTSDVNVSSATINVVGCSILSLCPNQTTDYVPNSRAYCPALGAASEIVLFGALGVEIYNPTQVIDGEIGSFPSTAISLINQVPSAGQLQPGTAIAYAGWSAANATFYDGFDITTPVAPGAYIPSTTIYQVTGAINPGRYSIPSAASAFIVNNVTFQGTGGISDLWVFSSAVPLQVSYGVNFAGQSLVRAPGQIFWLVNSTVDPYLNGNGPAAIVGNIIAMDNVYVNAYLTAQGRIWSLNGWLALSGGSIQSSGCVTQSLRSANSPPLVAPTGSPVPPPTAVPVSPPTTAPPTTPSQPSAQTPADPLSIAGITIGVVAAVLAIVAIVAVIAASGACAPVASKVSSFVATAGKRKGDFSSISSPPKRKGLTDWDSESYSLLNPVTRGDL